MPEINETLGQRIKRLRIERNMSQEQLAERLGYKSRSSINKIELGINDITQTKVIEFAEVLRITPAYLMGWDDNEGNTLTIQVSDKFEPSVWKLTDEQTIEVIELLRKFERGEQ